MKCRNVSSLNGVKLKYPTQTQRMHEMTCNKIPLKPLVAGTMVDRYNETNLRSKSFLMSFLNFHRLSSTQVKYGQQ